MNRLPLFIAGMDKPSHILPTHLALELAVEHKPKLTDEKLNTQLATSPRFTLSFIRFFPRSKSGRSVRLAKNYLLRI